MTIAEKITAKMKELNISYREMEAITSIPKSTIQRYAKGEAIWYSTGLVLPTKSTNL